MSQVRYIRALALRVDTLPQFAYRSVTTRPLSTTTTPMLVNQLDVAVDPAAQYLALGTMRVDDTCAGVVPGARGISYTVDDAMFGGEHLPNNCAHEMTYGHLDLLPTAPAQLTAAFWAGSGEEMRHEETTLLVLGVD